MDGSWQRQRRRQGSIDRPVPRMYLDRTGQLASEPSELVQVVAVAGHQTFHVADRPLVKLGRVNN
jgi:hypothetical protein